MSHIDRKDLHFGALSAMGPVRCVAVLDTDHLINEVRESTCGRTRAAMVEASSAGTVRLFAAAHVFDEMYAPDAFGHADKCEKLAEQAVAAGCRRTADDFRSTFEEEFLPRIHFVDLPADAPTDPLVDAVAEQHASDAPTAQLAVLLGPAVVFSCDKHLRRPGVAPPDIGPAVAAARGLAAPDRVLAGLSIGAVLLVETFAHASTQLARFLRVPRGVVVAGSIAAGALLLNNPRRRERLAIHRRSAAEGLGQMMAQGAEAWHVLSEHSVTSSLPWTVERRLARVLAEADQPLLATELFDKLQRDSELVTALTDVRALLAAHPAFCHPQGDRYRWQVGRRRRPALLEAQDVPPVDDR